MFILDKILIKIGKNKMKHSPSRNFIQKTNIFFNKKQVYYDFHDKEYKIKNNKN